MSNCALLVPEKPLTLPFLTDDEISNLTECELRTLTDIVYPTDPALNDIYTDILTTLLYPSGNWVDFNPNYKTWLGLKDLIQSKLFGDVSVPAEPLPSDYPNI